ncbi:MAG: hypothetical protein H7839_10590 [Magnetococcus sp. YQC-5]
MTPSHGSSGYRLTIDRPRSMKVRVLTLLSYVSILCLIPLILSRDDAFIHFHARQGLVLWLWGLLCIIGLNLPGLGPFLAGISVVIIVVLSLAGMVGVLFSKQWKLPLIGGLAAKL